ncbi:NAD-dependent succinate-semialdehyde dehydrogenase [Chryseolinea lacunae]|uniref:NAD-dependent succinate-semialdehyde dehydrogenase n=1 Tax=Chryseolinea lacunae TaxID=2801331 RepID=A0ABS1KL23_9BACT|nr:NAD-dependent succinate-semialdehyde dehydrogenase [Chryseolinea lacunae]MBL0740154.1 NAD-dependent succinate-semialdehyde dehydrogenase [Chryseolinea lacunae]
MLKSINPFDQTVVAEFPLMETSLVQQKIDKAGMAYKSWKRTTFADRAALMQKAAALLKANKEEYARTITLEMGKVLTEARAEVEKSAGACEFFANNAEKFLADQVIATDARRSLVSHHATGAILAVMPWNFPFWQVIRFAAPALMAGNVGLLKHASNVPQCSLLLEKVFHEAGFPEGVFQSLLIENKTLEDIIKSDVVQGVALTGSEFAGTQVGAIAGKHIKKTVLELGGSDPFIVFADADLEKTAKIATQSRMQNAGQSCISAKRFIVVEQVKDEFVSRFEANIKALKQGNPFDAHITTGPLARVDLAETLEKQMNASVKQGARLVTGGQRTQGNFQPALIDHVKPGIPAFDEETFGPLAAVITARNEEEAVALANASRYGLGASIWTQDIEKGERWAREVESGSVFINALMKSDQRLPFGGTKKSGYGRELSEAGIKEFVNVKTISIA